MLIIPSRSLRRNSSEVLGNIREFLGLSSPVNQDNPKIITSAEHSGENAVNNNLSDNITFEVDHSGIIQSYFPSKYILSYLFILFIYLIYLFIYFNSIKCIKYNFVLLFFPNPMK